MKWPWQKRTPPPERYRRYQEQMGMKTWSPSTLIADLPIVVLDAETTGMDARKDRLISLSAVVVRGREVLLNRSFDALVRNPYGQEGRTAAQVHGILASESARGEDEVEVIFHFLEFIQGHWLAGHFIGHDIGILDAILKKAGCPPLQNRVLDTATLYRRWQQGPLPTEIPENMPISLDHLCRELNVPVQDRHTAAGDTLMTALVLIRLLGKLEKRGILRVKDL
ncbi:MAG: 3'-5' exonuclease [Saprospiraceae bacterium]